MAIYNGVDRVSEVEKQIQQIMYDGNEVERTELMKVIAKQYLWLQIKSPFWMLMEVNKYLAKGR